MTEDFFGELTGMLDSGCISSAKDVDDFVGCNESLILQAAKRLDGGTGGEFGTRRT